MTGSNSGPTGLTGAKIGLTGAPSKSGNSSGTKDKKRPSFKELLAKYEKKGAVQKLKEPSNKVKDTKPSSELQERSGQGNYASSNGPIAPWYCWCPYFYTSMDYSRMHMQSYYIQYPSIYPNHASPQRPIVASNNLVKKDVDCSKEVEKSAKQDSKYLQPRWCPSGLSHTQKRRLQCMRKRESMEQPVEVEPIKPVAMKKVWRPKQIVSLST